MSSFGLGVKPLSMEVNLTSTGNFVAALRRKTGDWDDDTTIVLEFDDGTRWPATVAGDTAVWNVAHATVGELIEADPNEALLVITAAGTPLVRGSGQIYVDTSVAVGVTFGGSGAVLDDAGEIIVVPVPGIPGQDGQDGAPGAKGDKGDTGDAGTTDYNELENKPNLALKADVAALSDETQARVDGDATITTALGSKADLVGGTVPANQLPSYVDDVLEFVNLAAFPGTGVAGKIYVAQDTNLTYRWSGSAYGVLDPSLALGENSTTAYRGDRGKTAYDHSQATGNPHGLTRADIGAQSAASLDADTAALVPGATALGAAVAANQLTGLTAAGTRRDAVDARVAIPTRSQVQHRLAGTTEPGAFIAWTADDGYTTQPSFFALLAARGLKGTLFLSTGFVDKAGTNVTWGDTYITTAQVNALVAAGHELGTHGVNHEAYEDYRVANGDAALSALVASAVATIKTSFGVDVKTGAYPGGQSSPRVREIVGRTHEFYRGTKGVVAHRGQPPFDVSGIDIRDLTEAQIKAYVDEANAAGSLVVFLLHGGLTAPMLTAFGNVMDYATGLGIRQGTFNQGMTERTAIRGSAGMMVDTKGNAYAQSLRTPRVELTRDDSTAGITPYWSIDPITNVPFYDAGSSVPFEFRKPIKLVGTTSDLNIGTRTIFGDGVTTNLSATLDSGAAGFDQSDVGRTITGAGIPGGTTILAVVSPTRVTMSAQASVTATSVVITLGRPTNPVLNAAGQSIFFNNPQVRSSGSPAVVFQDLISTALGTISPATWSRAAAGGAMLIDSGTGGSYVTIKAFGVKYTDHTGALTITNKLGTGTPEGALAANPGSVFHRTDGGAGTSFYVKESGTGNTGWVAK